MNAQAFWTTCPLASTGSSEGYPSWLMRLYQPESQKERCSAHVGAACAHGVTGVSCALSLRMMSEAAVATAQTASTRNRWGAAAGRSPGCSEKERLMGMTGLSTTSSVRRRRPSQTDCRGVRVCRGARAVSDVPVAPVALGG